MKKFLVSALFASIVASLGSVFAQTATHDVTISIPDVAFLRFTATDEADDFDAVAPDAVVFDLTIADVQGADAIVPSNAGTANWGDLKVFVNYGASWEVTVEVEDTSSGPAFVWSKVGVGAWALTDGDVVGTGTETGWNSLGFGPSDFLLNLDGTELADDYSATVTYSLAVF